MVIHDLNRAIADMGNAQFVLHWQGQGSEGIAPVAFEVHKRVRLQSMDWDQDQEDVLETERNYGCSYGCDDPRVLVRVTAARAAQPARAPMYMGWLFHVAFTGFVVVASVIQTLITVVYAGGVIAVRWVRSGWHWLRGF